MPPIEAKRARTAEASFSGGPPPTTASSRISRTSCSMEHPCSAARTRSLRLTSSSRLRIVMLAITSPASPPCRITTLRRSIEARWLPDFHRRRQLKLEASERRYARSNRGIQVSRWLAPQRCSQNRRHFGRHRAPVSRRPSTQSALDLLVHVANGHSREFEPPQGVLQ